MIETNTPMIEYLPVNELKIGIIYKVQFLNGFKMLVKFTGFEGKRYYFVNQNGREFSIAENSIQYLNFYPTRTINTEI
jgi:hypothetical protein